MATSARLTRKFFIEHTCCMTVVARAMPPAFHDGKLPSNSARQSRSGTAGGLDVVKRDCRPGHAVKRSRRRFVTPRQEAIKAGPDTMKPGLPDLQSVS